VCVAQPHTGRPVAQFFAQAICTDRAACNEHQFAIIGGNTNFQPRAGNNMIPSRLDPRAEERSMFVSDRLHDGGFRPSGLAAFGSASDQHRASFGPASGQLDARNRGLIFTFLRAKHRFGRARMAIVIITVPLVAATWSGLQPSSLNALTFIVSNNVHAAITAEFYHWRDFLSSNRPPSTFPGV
jgi:hypothetical protein